MGADSKIEWTHHTFNPWWGCVKVSPECKHCYAETWDKRTGGSHWGAGGARRFFGDKHWNEPLKWNREAEAAGERRRVFCSSMADVFEDRADLAPHRDRLWSLINSTPWLDWLLLTKRPENLSKMLPWMKATDPDWRRSWPNVWLGASVGCNETLWRLGELSKVEAVVRFVSAEPLLEQVSFRRFLMPMGHRHGGQADDPHVCCCGKPEAYHRPLVDWIIAGGESGPRPMHPAWARLLRDECDEAGVAFLFKQWGSWSEIEYDRNNPPGDRQGERYLNVAGGHGFHGDQVVRIRTATKKANGRELDGSTWDGYPTARTP